MVDYLQQVKIGNNANTRKTYTPSKSSKITAPVACQATGFDRELLPVPVSYYEAKGLTLQGSRGAEWKTTECRFHGGSDSLRIKVTTGAFVCMACGAKGGDVLAYEMATHGIGFIDAAKQLGVWAGGDAPHRHIRPTALTARDALSVLADEANLIAIESGRMAEGIKPSPEDRARFLVAVGRFNHVWGMFA